MERVYTAPLLDKLGVRAGARVSLIGEAVMTAWFRELLADRTDDVIVGMPDGRRDLIFIGADSPAELDVLSRLVRRLVSTGAIWVVSRKGRTATLRDVQVIAAAKAVGLVDNKVASFSDTHTALRLVVPVAMRRTIGGR
jgi:hypothetical protein